MLDTIYMQILDMSKTAGIVILVVLLARLLLKKAPKVFSYALWAVVLFRLLCFRCCTAGNHCVCCAGSGIVDKSCHKARVSH